MAEQLTIKVWSLNGGNVKPEEYPKYLKQIQEWADREGIKYIELNDLGFCTYKYYPIIYFLKAKHAYKARMEMTIKVKDRKDVNSIDRLFDIKESKIALEGTIREA